MSLIVVCVKWGPKYPAQYANILHSMVQRHLSAPFEFVCYTDDPRGLAPGIRTIPIPPSNTVGWWHKLSLFKPGLFPPDCRILYFDLDIVIVGSLDFLLESKAPFTIIRSWKTKYRTWNSSVMLFDPPATHFIYERFQERSADIMRSYKSDQDWIFECTKDTAANWPDAKIISFKRHCRALAYPFINKRFRRLKLKARASAACPPPDPEAAVICFHGEPNPIDVRDGPYREWMRAPFVAHHWR